MIPTALLVAALALPLAPCPQANPDEFITRQAQGVTLNYSLDLAPQDVDAFLGAVGITRDVMRLGLGIQLTADPVIQLRQRKNARRAYFTDGVDRIYFDFPSIMYFFRLQYADPRVLKYTIPSFLQLWLYRSLSSTAGLDPRILGSLVEYCDYLVSMERARTTKGEPPAPPSTTGQAWYQLEAIYPGTTAFVLNVLSSQKVPGHMVGQVLRETAIAGTEDPEVGKIFDLIAPPEPILAAADLAPGALLVPTLPIHPGRAALFNGTPLLDMQGPEIAAMDRIAEFDTVFEMLALTVPATTITDSPPSVRGIDLWPFYFEFRPRVLMARDNLDYFLVLREFLGRFKDRAIVLRPTPALPVCPGAPMWSSVFGLSFARVGDRIYVARVTGESEPARAGMTPGLEILSIDGRPAARSHDLLTEAFQILDSCPSHRRAQAAALDNLLSGAQGSECVLEFRDPAAPPPRPGEPAPRREIRFTRGLPPPPPPTAFTVEHELRAGDQVGVIRVRQFMGDALARFAVALDDLARQGAKAIVIDLRGNEGLRDPRNPASVGLAMLARILPPGSGKFVVGSSVNRNRNRFDDFQSKEIVVAPTPTTTNFAGPVAVLTDAWTGGESELFVLGFQLAKRGIVAGETTAGSVSTPMETQPFQSLTRSRLELSFAASVIVRPNNDPVQAIGITPQELVEPDPADLRVGRDTVLERAVALLVGRP